jgi:hypothetical protein
MSKPTWRVRVAKASDERLLKRFKCAEGEASWQTEVERYINADLLGWVMAPGAAQYDPQVLLLFSKSTLVGVAAHEKKTLGAGDVTFPARELHVLALSTKWHGKKFTDGRRASDVLMVAALSDIASRDGVETRVFAVVHRENQAALRMCERHGLVGEMSSAHPDYRRLLTIGAVEESEAPPLSAHEWAQKPEGLELTAAEFEKAKQLVESSPAPRPRLRAAAKRRRK